MTHASSHERLQALLDQATTDVTTALRLTTGRRLEPAAIDAVRAALEPLFRAARLEGALHPGYREPSAVVAIEQNDAEDISVTRQGFRSRPPKAR